MAHGNGWEWGSMQRVTLSFDCVARSIRDAGRCYTRTLGQGWWSFSSLGKYSSESFWRLIGPVLSAGAFSSAMWALPVCHENFQQLLGWYKVSVTSCSLGTAGHLSSSRDRVDHPLVQASEYIPQQGFIKPTRFTKIPITTGYTTLLGCTGFVTWPCAMVLSLSSLSYFPSGLLI